LATRFYLAKKVFALTGRYDTAIADWLQRLKLPDNLYSQEGPC
jgi:AICAR transformylase/IMP cyclohydrolase PurH